MPMPAKVVSGRGEDLVQPTTDMLCRTHIAETPVDRITAAGRLQLQLWCLVVNAVKGREPCSPPGLPREVERRWRRPPHRFCRPSRGFIAVEGEVYHPVALTSIGRMRRMRFCPFLPLAPGRYTWSR